MKIFAFIMASIILIMSGTPCQDATVVQKSKMSHTSYSLSYSHGHEEPGDDCSPLCSCACCSAHPFPQSSIGLAVQAADISLTHSSFYTGSLISVSIPVWQPPQLVG